MGRSSRRPCRGARPRRRSSCGRLWRFATGLVTLASCPGIGIASEATPRQQFLLEIPSVSLDDVENNATLRSLQHPFVIRDYFSGKWKAAIWTLDYLNAKIPFEWADYYPRSMADEKKKPYPHRFSDGLSKLRTLADDSKLLQVRLGFRGWKRLAKDFVPKPLPEVIWTDDEWIRDCMVDGGKADEQAIDNFFVTNEWRQIVVGEKGTEIFFHRSSTPTSAWYAQLVGRTKWTLCPNSQTQSLDQSINTFKPDEAVKKFPKFAQALCGQVTVEPGDLLYNPTYMWHHTYHLDTPSIAYTGKLVGSEKFKDITTGNMPPYQMRMYTDIMDKCDKCWTKGNTTMKCEDISIQDSGRAPPPQRVVCHGYIFKCYKLWDEHEKSWDARLKEKQRGQDL